MDHYEVETDFLLVKYKIEATIVQDLFQTKSINSLNIPCGSILLGSHSTVKMKSSVW